MQARSKILPRCFGREPVSDRHLPLGAEPRRPPGMLTGCLAPLNRGGATMQSEIAPWAFVLAVPDINKSAQYFRDVLGFRELDIMRLVLIAILSLESMVAAHSEPGHT